MIFQLILFAFILLYIFIKIKIRHAVKVSENIPGEKSFPIIGNCNLLFKLKNLVDAWELVNYMYENYGKEGIIKFWFGPILGIGIWDPSYIEVVANSPYAVSKGPVYHFMFGEVLDGVVMTEGGQKWRELRKPIVKSLSKKLFDTEYHFIFVKRSNTFTKYIRDQKCGVEFDIFLYVSNLLLDIFAETHLGVQTNEVVEQNFNWVKNFDAYLDSVAIIIAKYHFYFKKIGQYLSSEGKSLRESKHEMIKFHQWIFAERKKCYQESKGNVEYYSDFLLRRAIEKKLSSHEIEKELGDLILAASDTSSVVISSALVFLAMFPEVQEEAYQEQLSIFENSDRDPTVEDIASMAFLKMVMKETMRLIGVPTIFRIITGDIKLDKYTIPKGSILYIGLHQVHKNPKYWEKPETFYPNHFLPEKEAARPRYTYIPFGVAPRVCAGFQYGMNTIMIILSTLIRNFEITTSMKYEEIVFEHKLLLQMHNGYNVKLNKRNKT